MSSRPSASACSRLVSCTRSSSGFRLLGLLSLMRLSRRRPPPTETTRNHNRPDQHSAEGAVSRSLIKEAMVRSQKRQSSHGQATAKRRPGDGQLTAKQRPINGQTTANDGQATAKTSHSTASRQPAQRLTVESRSFEARLKPYPVSCRPPTTPGIINMDVQRPFPSSVFDPPVVIAILTHQAKGRAYEREHL